MSPQFYKLLFYFLCLYLTRHQTNAKSLSIEKINKHCVSESGVDPALIGRVIKNQEVENDDKYKDFLVCLYKYQGYVDINNKVIIYDKIDTFLSQYYTHAEHTFAVNSCKSLKYDAITELVYKTAECLLNKLHEVEQQRQNQQQNDEDSNNNDV